MACSDCPPALPPHDWYVPGPTAPPVLPPELLATLEELEGDT